MKALHWCPMDMPDLPDNISRVDRFWRCPVCGQWWRQTIHHGSGEAARVYLPNFKLWRWNRQAEKELR